MNLEDLETLDAAIAASGGASAVARSAAAQLRPYVRDALMPEPRTLDLRDLANRKAPPREWFIHGWLGPGPTLFAAGGGTGKTLLAQQIATAGALGQDFVGSVTEPFRSLIVACEDEADELWRRQEDIAAHFDVPLDAPADSLVIQSRLGLDNLLMTLDRGKLWRTPAFEELQQQVNDLGVDVLWLDNVAHLFGATSLIVLR